MRAPSRLNAMNEGDVKILRKVATSIPRRFSRKGAKAQGKAFWKRSCALRLCAFAPLLLCGRNNPIGPNLQPEPNKSQRSVI